MTSIDEFPRTQGETRCSYHPNVLTNLRCSRCGKPICPKCAVRTPVGMRCPECAGVRGLPTYRTTSTALVKATGAGLIVAIAVGVLWGFYPDWQFYLALLLGFGVAEAMAWACNAKRGRDLQILAVGLILLGLVLGRVVFVWHNDLPWSIFHHLDNQIVRDQILYLRIIPDLLFAVMAMAIGWIRFR